MSKMAVGTAAALLVAATVGSAAAADLPESPSPVAVAAGVNWTGLYAGLKGSYNWADSSGTVNDPFLGAHPMLATKPNGAEIGGEIGYNFEMPGSHFVLGASADFQTGGFSASASATTGFFPFTATTTGEEKINNLGTVQARLGYAMGKWLPYVTGGYAYGEGSHTTTVSSFFGTNVYSDSKWYSGWTVGAGLEYALNHHWSVKGEYRYTDLGSETLNVGYPTSIKLTSQAVDFGMNYRF